ncbi:MAG: hypothetical protein PHE54_00925 [Bacilli bacterium]|nr:hypothetical protein [Bacilli bacterium]
MNLQEILFDVICSDNHVDSSQLVKQQKFERIFSHKVSDKVYEYLKNHLII